VLTNSTRSFRTTSRVVIWGCVPDCGLSGTLLYEALSGFWRASCGIAAIPTAALDPPHSAASPAVPALIGSGSPLCRLLQLSNPLEFGEQLRMVLGQVPHNGCAP
jgi:hypothetical protein